MTTTTPEQLHTPTLIDAANRAAEVLAESACDVAIRFTCTEADVMADLLRATGRTEAAESFLEFHADDDEPGDAHYPGDPEEAERIAAEHGQAVVAAMPGDRGQADAIQPGDHVTVFAHPVGRFGESMGAAVSGWVKDRTRFPKDLPGTTDKGMRITFTDGRQFDCLLRAATTWHQP